MELPSHYNSKSGFSYVEIVLAIGLIAVIASFVLPLSTSSLYSYLLASERSILVSVLTDARSRAMANIGRTPYSIVGVPEGYMLFRGTEFDSSSEGNELTRSHGSVAKVFSIPTITFMPLSGSSSEVEISLSIHGRVRVVTINLLGAINS